MDNIRADCEALYFDYPTVTCLFIRILLDGCIGVSSAQ
jgi:hypothetical protein